MDDRLREMLAGIRHVALDMDGTIYLGSRLFPYTVPFLEKLGRLGISYSFLTNNPTRSIDDYVAKLHRLGVPCTHDQMYSTTTAKITSRMISTMGRLKNRVSPWRRKAP